MIKNQKSRYSNYAIAAFYIINISYDFNSIDDYLLKNLIALFAQ